MNIMRNGQEVAMLSKIDTLSDKSTNRVKWRNRRKLIEKVYGKLYRYTKKARIAHEPCPNCGMWHSSMSCAPQWYAQRAADVRAAALHPQEE